jgi:sugar phosphate permease
MAAYRPQKISWAMSFAPSNSQPSHVSSNWRDIPVFPVKFYGVDKLHAAFLNESRTHGRCLMPRTGKPGIPSIESEAREVAAPSSIFRGSNRRWLVLWLLLLITIINFIDRQTVSVLAPVIRASLHLSNAQYGRIVAAFQFGMMTAEFPMGWLMDRWGVRFGLLGAVLWWSAATGTQSITKSGLQLGITRFWMGTGECGNYSGGMKAIFGAFAPGERTLAIGIFNSGSMIGSTLAPPLIVFLAQRYSFRAAFLVPALLGLVWAPFWFLLYRDPARQKRSAIEAVSL